MKKFNKRMGRSRSGVSDIIGNLLILAITVTLFSSIMFYVANMPEPAQATFTDLEADTPVITGGGPYSTWINVTHKGGQTLEDRNLGIYLFINGKLADEGEKRISHTENAIGSDGKWTTGETWSNKTLSTELPTSISIMMVDKGANAIVWQSDILGGASDMDLPPIIANRYTVPYVGTVGKPLSFYVTVIDPNGNLDYSNVTLNAVYVSGSTSSSLEMDYKGSNVFNYTLTPTMASESGTTVIITATDLAGNTARALMDVVVYPKPGTTTNPSGGVPSTIEMSGLQGFNTFEKEDWNENNFSATPREMFDSGQDVELVIISRLLVNLDIENTVFVLNGITKAEVRLLEMEYFDYFSGIFVYTLAIDDLEDGKYLLQIQLKDSYIPNNIFFAVAQIQVGSASALPEMNIYYDSAYTKQYSIDDDDDEPFETTDIIYFTVTANHGYPWLQYGGDVIITDFIGRQQIKRVPDLPTQTTTPPNPVKFVDREYNVYYFQLDLKKANQDPWLASTNTYLLAYDIFKTYDADSEETESSVLIEKVKIAAPKFRLDIVAAIEMPKNSAQLAKDTMVYYENDNLWSPGDIIQGYPDRNKEATGLFVETADMNGDLKGDIVAIVEGEGDIQLNYYLNDGSWTNIRIADLTETPTSMALGNIDFDNDKDIVVGFSNGRVTAYRNDGIWTPITLSYDGGSPVTKVLMADLDINKDTNVAGRSMDIVVGRNAGGIDIYQNYDGALIDPKYFNYDGQKIVQGTEYNASVNSEQSILGIVTEGTDFNNLTADDESYEIITEAVGLLQQTGNCIPYRWNEDDTSNDIYTRIPIDVLKVEDEWYVNLTNALPKIGVNVWTRDTGLVTTAGTVKSLNLDIVYSTSKNLVPSVSIYSEFVDSTLTTDLDTSFDKGYVKFTTRSISVDPTAYKFDTFDNLAKLRFSMDTSGIGNTDFVYIDYVALEVEMVYQGTAISHILNVTVSDTDGGSTNYILNVNAHSSSETQYFEVAVSMADKNYYTRAFVIGGTTDQDYSFRLPSDANEQRANYSDYKGTINIRIRSVPTGSSVVDSVHLDNVSIYSFTTLSSGIGSVAGLAVGKLYQANNSNQIVIMDTSGDVFVSWYNYLYSGTGGVVGVTDFSTSIINVKEITIGYVDGTKNGRMDIMVVTTSVAYVLDHNETTVFKFDKKILNANIAAIDTTLYSTCIGDVNGDQYLDFVGGTQNGHLYLFRNLLGNMWQTIEIDYRYEVVSNGGNTAPYAFVDIGIGKLEDG